MTELLSDDEIASRLLDSAWERDGNEIVRDLKLTADQQESIGKAYAERQQTVAAFPQRTPQNTEEVSRKQTEANVGFLARLGRL